MALYSVYLPRSVTAEGRNPAENALFIKDGFSWGAFLVPFIWLSWHRVWRWLLVYIVFETAIFSLGERLGLSTQMLSAIGLLVMLFVGVSARDWLAVTLERRGYRLADIVQGMTQEDAEKRFFDRFQGAKEPARTLSQQRQPLSQTRGVVGLFPDERGTR